MALSKVKSKKQRARLNLRLIEYEKSSANGYCATYSGHKFTKPGSNRK